MSVFSIEKSKKHIAELGKGVNEKKDKIEKLEVAKKEVVDARTAIEGADISQEYKKEIVRNLMEKREQISAQGKKIGNEIGKDLKNIETEVQEIQRASDANTVQQKNLESKKSVLEKVGMGKLMENAIGQLQNEGKQLESITENILELRKKTEDTTKRANSL